MIDGPPRQRRDCRCPRARHQHGTKGAYLYDRCRCPSCSAANAAHARAYRRKVAQRHWNGGTDWTDSIGTRRRLRALAAAGWSLTELAPHLGMSASGVGWLRQIDGPCLRSTAQRIATVYDLLWDVPPTGRAVTRTRSWALRRGWLPPLAWDDDEIDDPDAQPHTPAGPSPWDHKPCGTASAARRHWRNGEPLDEACKAASRRQTNERRARKVAMRRLAS